MARGRRLRGHRHRQLAVHQFDCHHQRIFRGSSVRTIQRKWQANNYFDCFEFSNKGNKLTNGVLRTSIYCFYRSREVTITIASGHANSDSADIDAYTNTRTH